MLSSFYFRSAAGGGQQADQRRVGDAAQQTAGRRRWPGVGRRQPGVGVVDDVTGVAGHDAVGQVRRPH